ncbi:PEP-utilizing enzyme [Ammoniphilus resinae]|uniref:Pyruvate,water dikinase n=1 Tax=Ammoniphilus resinae TaxID=861532 RepID=A0ABS4GPB6_9BACL|nr:PEP-utilizing enzyme [Ammoniphilus resinae]MBP1932120.1 pyruvate,water dikinase [Ammoniphilus resinae]
MTQLDEFQNQLYLSEEDKKQGFWMQDEVHLAHALSPLYASYMLPAMTHGTKKAFETVKSPVLQFKMKYSDGRAYQATPPYPGNFEERLGEHQKFAQSRFPVMKKVLFDYVDQELLPFYNQLDDARRGPLSREQARQLVQQLHAFYERAWELHFEIVTPRSALCMALESLYGELTGEENATAVYELLTGVMNKTLETDRELWNLAEQMKAVPEVAAVLLKEPSGEWLAKLSETEAGQAFLAKLELFLEAYGYRTQNSHEFLDPTWVENPEHVLTTLSEYIQKNYSFEGEFTKGVRERERKYEQTLSRMPEGEKKAVFVQLYQWALDSWGLDEDHHFYIDAMLPAKSRLFLLEVGKLLVQEQVLTETDDLFYLHYDELVKCLAGTQKIEAEVIAERKRTHEENKQKKVPPFYGEPPAGMGEDPIISRIFGTKQPEVSHETFNGYGSSQGIYTGVVKVVKGPEEFSKVKQGDVLVCRTTTPPWTVLFSIVGAVITDAGGILSHAGTVAREYGIPAVVGSRVATSILKDGDLVTVDGTSGVVTFGKR